MRILLVEPDSCTSRSIDLMLSQAGFNIYATDNGVNAFDLIEAYDYDLVILESHLPDGPGLEVLKKVRKAGNNIPVVFLSSDDSTENKIQSFGHGADDFISKPFHREELVSRLIAIVRRSEGHSSSTIEIKGLTLNLDEKTVKIGGNQVNLTSSEYKLLEVLALRKNKVQTKEQIMDYIYGGRDEPSLQTIDVYVYKLRKKLSPLTNGDGCIETVWGRGYVLREGEAG